MPDSGVAYGQNIGQSLFLVAIFLIFYFFAILPSRRKQAMRMRAVASMSEGDRVVLASGMTGTYVRKADGHNAGAADAAEDEYLVEVSEGVVVCVSEAGIAGVTKSEANR